jgi:hypothetical protein
MTLKHPLAINGSDSIHRYGPAIHCATFVGDRQESIGESRFKQGETYMADKGKKDKGKKEQQKTAKLSPKEKRKQKKEKRREGTNAR